MLRIKHSNHSKNSPSPFWLKDRLAASQQNGTAMKPLYFTPGFIPTPNGKVDVKLEREHVQPGHVFESAYLESPQLPERDLYAPLPSEAQLDETLKKLTVLREELVFISKDEYQQFWLNIYNREPPIGLDHNKMNTFQGLKSIVNKATYLGYQDKATETGNKLCRQVLQNCYYKIPEASEMAAHIKNKYALVMRNPPASKCKDFIEKICSNAKNDLNKDFPMIFVQPNKTQFPDAFSPLLKLEDLLSKKGKEKLEAKSDLTVSTSSLSSPSTNSATNDSNAGTLATIDKDMIYANIDLKNNTPISPTEIISLLTLAEVGGNNEESSTASLLNEDKMPALPDLKMPAFNEPSGSDYDFENDSDIIGIYDVHVKKQYVPVHRKVAKPTMNISEILNSKKILKDTNQKRKDDQKEKKEAKRTKVSKSSAAVKNGSAATSVVCCGKCDLKIFSDKSFKKHKTYANLKCFDCGREFQDLVQKEGLVYACSQIAKGNCEKILCNGCYNESNPRSRGGNKKNGKKVEENAENKK